MVSPVDGVERFVALTEVPAYSMIVLVSRDASVALAAWREQAVGTAVRTLVLGALAALLLTLLMRKLARLRAASASLEASKERFAAAVAGSDDGIWDWDVQAKRVFASARAREILGMPPGPEKNDAARMVCFTAISSGRPGSTRRGDGRAPCRPLAGVCDRVSSST